MKIKIVRSKPLKEVEDEVRDQQLDITTSPAPQEITYESNPLEFILQKYPSLNKQLIDLLIN